MGINPQGLHNLRKGFARISQYSLGTLFLYKDNQYSRGRWALSLTLVPQYPHGAVGSSPVCWAPHVCWESTVTVELPTGDLLP